MFCNIKIWKKKTKFKIEKLSYGRNFKIQIFFFRKIRDINKRKVMVQLIFKYFVRYWILDINEIYFFIMFFFFFLWCYKAMKMISNRMNLFRKEFPSQLISHLEFDLKFCFSWTDSFGYYFLDGQKKNLIKKILKWNQYWQLYYITFFENLEFEFEFFFFSQIYLLF